MRPILLVARREWRAFIGSPAGYVVVGLYLLLAGYLFALHVSVTREASLRFTFASLATLTLFTVPLITMRLLAEEMRSGTFEVLVAHPVSDWQIVLGKLLAGWWVFLALSAPTLSYLLALAVLGAPDWGSALAGYLGLQLMALELLALGLLISATTHSQVLAAMGGMVGGLLLWLAGTASTSLRGALGEAVGYLAILEHFAPFRRGVIDTRSVVYFVSTAAMLVYLAVRAVESRRWKFGLAPGGVPRSWRRPRLSLALLGATALLASGALVAWVSAGLWSRSDSALLGGAAVAAAVPFWLNRVRLRYEVARRRAGLALTVGLNSLLVIAIWGLVTYLASAWYLRLDLTGSQRYALSEQTLLVLDEIDARGAPVEVVVAMGDPADLRQEILDLLAEYAARSPLIQVRRVDPARSPGELERIREAYGLSSPPTGEVLIATGGEARRIPVASMVRQFTRLRPDGVESGPVEFAGEAEVTANLVRLTRGEKGRVVFLVGHGERSPDDGGPRGASTAAAELRRQGWSTQAHVVTPAAGAAVFPPDTEVVVVAGPHTPLSDESLRVLGGFLDSGGGVLALLDPGVDGGLEPLIVPWGLRLADNLVVDPRSHVAAADPTALYVNRFNQDHPLGKGMGTLGAVLPTARRIGVTLTHPDPHVTTWHLFHTSGDGWAVAYQRGARVAIDPDRDRRGPISLAVAAERYEPRGTAGDAPLQGRLMVVGDSDWLANQHVDLAGNLTLALNSVDWLAGRQDLVSVRPKPADLRLLELTASRSRGLYWFGMLLVPGGTLLAMAALALRRRRLA